jgi:hypothetical protein
MNYLDENVEYFKLYKVANNFANTSDELITRLTEFGYNLMAIHRNYQRVK